jgi:hypothetical protein
VTTQPGDELYYTVINTVECYGTPTVSIPGLDEAINLPKSSESEFFEDLTILAAQGQFEKLARKIKNGENMATVFNLSLLE